MYARSDADAVDAFARECRMIGVDVSLGGARVLAAIERLRVSQETSREPTSNDAKKH